MEEEERAGRVMEVAVYYCCYYGARDIFFFLIYNIPACEGVFILLVFCVHVGRVVIGVVEFV